MRIPAIRAKIGSWTYYVTTLTFEQVDNFVSRVDDELHQSESLKDLIQRSITKNYLSIKEYILNQPEIFFNALVLAVYNDYPDWREIEFKYGEGFEFEKIIPFSELDEARQAYVRSQDAAAAKIVIEKVYALKKISYEAYYYDDDNQLIKKIKFP